MKNFFVFLFACCAQAVSAHIAFFCATCANAPSGTNIANIEKMAEKRGTDKFVYEEKLYFCN